MSQELHYLRDELNQRMTIQSELSNKLISLVLIAWGGFFLILEKSTGNFLELKAEKTTLYFVGATIFFISNMINYSMARKYYRHSHTILRIGAYILVFYEKRPNNNDNKRDKFCWEMVNFETLAHDVDKKIKRKSNFYDRWGEYVTLCVISLFLILFFSYLFFVVPNDGKTVIIVPKICCIVYIVCSVCMLWIILKDLSLKSIYNMRVKHLYDTFRYSFKIGYHSEEKIKDLFGDLYERCEKYMRKQKSSIT